MSALLQDLRYAARMLAKNAGFSAIAVATLALGIGANTTIFSVVRAVLIRPLPYPDADRLAGFSTNQSGPDLEDIARQSTRLSYVAGAQGWPLDWANGGEPERVSAAVVTGQAFAALGAAAELGRGILPTDDVAGAEPVVVIGHGFWTSRLGGDRGVLGRSLNFGGRPYTVVGVMPASFDVPRAPAQMWVAFHVLASEAAPERGAHLLRAFGRLAPGTSRAAAQAELDGIARRLKQVHPEQDGDQVFNLLPLQEQMVARSRPTLLLLFAAVAVVLLIACANFANLLISRSSRRSREIAIRSALGAGRGRLMRLLVTESVLLSVLGGAAGLVAAAWSQGVIAKLPPVPARLVEQVRLDSGVLLFALAVSVVTGIVFGLLPALALTRAAAAEHLGTRSSGTARDSRIAGVLVVAEIAVALVLLNGSALLFKGLSRLTSADPGFAADHLLTFRLDLPETRYKEVEPRTRFYRALTERLTALPGVKSAALISEIPLGGNRLDHNIVVEGGPVYPKGSEPSAYSRTTSAGYFRTMGIPIVRGRALEESDREGAPFAAVVNEAFARQFFSGRDPIGGRVRWARGPEDAWMTVVGLARNVHHNSLADEDGPALYTPYSQNAPPWKRWSSVVIRTQGEPRGMLAAAKEAVRSLDANLPVSEVATMEEVLRASTESPARRNLVLALFAGLALALAAVGVYGVLTQAVSRRKREFGVRMALGARRGDVVRLVLRQSLLLAGAGVLLGLAGGAFLSRAFLTSLLYGVSATDPLTYAAMAAVLIAATLLASGLPARRATRVDPMSALRSDG